jgi:hypothetical protein
MKPSPFGHGRAGPTEPSPKETLRVVEVFNRIFDPEMRAELIALAELYASSNPKFAEALVKRQSRH